MSLFEYGDDVLKNWGWMGSFMKDDPRAEYFLKLQFNAAKYVAFEILNGKRMILEIGCNTGILGRLIYAWLMMLRGKRYEKNFELHGLDIDAEKLKFCDVYDRVFCEDFRKFGEYRKYDVIVNLETIEMMSVYSGRWDWRDVVEYFELFKGNRGQVHIFTLTNARAKLMKILLSLEVRRWKGYDVLEVVKQFDSIFSKWDVVYALPIVPFSWQKGWQYSANEEEMRAVEREVKEWYDNFELVFRGELK